VTALDLARGDDQEYVAAQARIMCATAAEAYAALSPPEVATWAKIFEPSDQTTLRAMSFAFQKALFRAHRYCL